VEKEQNQFKNLITLTNVAVNLLVLKYKPVIETTKFVVHSPSMAQHFEAKLRWDDLLAEAEELYRLHFGKGF